MALFMTIKVIWNEKRGAARDEVHDRKGVLENLLDTRFPKIYFKKKTYCSR